MKATVATAPSASGLTQARINPPSDSSAASTRDDDEAAAAANRRARDAERKRLKRAADPELRQRLAASQRQRRAADPELRQREAAVKRQRRAADPDEVRARQAAWKRQRRATDPDFRAREAALKRRRREAALDAVRERDRVAKAASRARQRAQADARLKRDSLDRSFGHSCKASSKSAAASTRESRLPDEGGVSVAMTRPADSCSKRIDSKSEMQVGVVMVEIGESLNSSAWPESSRKLAESSQPSRRGVDVAVETPRISDQNLCKSSQASVVPIRIHRWTETTPLVHFMVLKLQQKCH
ncbi:uncharacterized protein LOC119164520 isoform X1 [Rhipicephalus microplus]|uniref:uncharacterized protein LOC119164520 isoform X1 n=1 Tax=Rhipicephalus microplus TaxID=6941 RepID=UPI003F6B18C7